MRPLMRPHKTKPYLSLQKAKLLSNQSLAKRLLVETLIVSNSPVWSRGSSVVLNDCAFVTHLILKPPINASAFDLITKSLCS